MRVMFVPVSGAQGMGEYARCLMLARAMQESESRARPHFLVSREAPYARDCPFPHTLLPHSPTLSGDRTTVAIRRFRPHVVVFDNAGRSAHLRTAWEVGAKIVYISSRQRQLRKALRLRWMNWIDEHWIAQPRDLLDPAGPLTWLKRLVLAAPPTLRHLDAVFPDGDPESRSRVLRDAGLAGERFVLVVPGGGTAHPGCQDAPATYRSAAAMIASAGYDVVVAGIDRPDESPQARAPRYLGRIAPERLAALMQAATLVVTNGGDTLLQALALGRPCVASAVASDQPRRIAQLQDAIRVAPLDAALIASAACELMSNETSRQRLAEWAAALGYRNALADAVTSLVALGRRATEFDPLPVDLQPVALQQIVSRASMPRRMPGSGSLVS